MSEILPISSPSPLNSVRKVEREKRQNQAQQQKPQPKIKHNDDDDDEQSKQHIDEIV